jgi:hypothetical protein
LTDIERRIAEFWKADKEPIRFRLNAETNKLSVQPPKDTTGLPAMIGLLVGETVYNLRSALDYLVFDLALFRTQSEQSGTQFPIEDSEDGWSRHAPGYLKGLCVEDVAAIKRCQPCKGLDFGGETFAWLAKLRDISNADKHRQWTPIAQTFQGSIFWKAADRGSFSEVDRGQIYSAVFSDGREVDVHVYGDLGGEVTFEDGAPIVKTIDEFLVKIKEVLDMFQPEFKGLAASMVRVQDSGPPPAIQTDNDTSTQ